MQSFQNMYTNKSFMEEIQRVKNLKKYLIVKENKIQYQDIIKKMFNPKGLKIKLILWCERH